MQNTNEELHTFTDELRAANEELIRLNRELQGGNEELAQSEQRYRTMAEGSIQAILIHQDWIIKFAVSSQGNPFSPTDCEALLANALSNLHVTVRETGAVVTHDPLPMVMADGLQLGQVFQNLISNALKFHGEACPRVHVSAEQRGKEWRFSIRDSGIGIDPQFSERIFVIFQRLHSREAYPGTGVGLAICKKIVERHGGRIWADSQPGQGAAFCFTLPAQRRREDKEKLTVVRTTLPGFLSSGHQG